MLTAIEGIYDNGQIILAEKPTTSQRVKVFVMFTDEKMEALPRQKRPFGIMKGSVKLSPDFNEPLEDLKEYM